MDINSNRKSNSWKQTLFRFRGEQLLLTTLWPQDYRKGVVYEIGGQAYRVTHFLRLQDQHEFEIWGKCVTAEEALSAQPLPAKIRQQPLQSPMLKNS